MKPGTLDEARAAKARVHEVFDRLVPVVGVGITRIGGGYGVKINLLSPPDPSLQLPDEVDGVPIRVEVVGPLRKAG